MTGFLLLEGFIIVIRIHRLMTLTIVPNVVTWRVVNLHRG